MLFAFPVTLIEQWMVGVFFLSLFQCTVPFSVDFSTVHFHHDEYFSSPFSMPRGACGFVA